MSRGSRCRAAPPAPTGPQPIDFRAALAGATLAGTGAPSSPAPLMGGNTFDAVLPIGNYGTGPLTLTAVTGGPGHLTARLAATSLVIPPGRVQQAAVQVAYAAPDAGEDADPRHPTVFALASDDPLAAANGPTAHFSTISLFAGCVPAGTVEVPSAIGFFVPRPKTQFMKPALPAGCLAKPMPTAAANVSRSGLPPVHSSRPGRASEYGRPPRWYRMARCSAMTSWEPALPCPATNRNGAPVIGTGIPTPPRNTVRW